ncbi:D-2-hydroxyglutarate dehydrogenase, mitochondrial [Diachasma alloeum]|uniref:D-2-hydroxyglutarate dehydrogenase, mitochondrial n=1 Tax=Diachasma alloeum TaxID=454923 RepID=UPI0007382DA5|nr:D-2-hydroxyglutarate dehydrogenase, mitochondrial [Diachasma alloeum]
MRANFKLTRKRVCAMVRADSMTGIRFATTSAKSDFTSVRYKVERGPFAEVTNNHIDYFRRLLGNRTVTDPEECEGYNIDWVKMVKGNSRLVLKPKTSKEVSEILKYCNLNRLAVCPQSGNTGLVGGSVPVFDEIILSMKLMNQIISTDELSGALVCEAGCVLDVLDNHLDDYGLMMPLDLGAKGSCLIGGNIATNAGGLRLLRYGNLHNAVLGLEAVTANGKIINCMNTLKKDNTGYHLKNLFIGSEGTLGIVTKVAIHCPTRPKSINLAFLGLDNFDKVLTTYLLAKKELAEVLSSCEMMDDATMGISVDMLGLQNPLFKRHKFYMLIETSGSNPSHDDEKLTAFVEKAMDTELIIDGTLTGDPTKMRQIWAVRERVGEGCLLDGYCFKYDVSLPLPYFYKLIGALKQRLDMSRIVRISGFGHLGDANLHVIVATPEYDSGIEAQLEPFLFEFISQKKGSVSAEHGIGFKKTNYLEYTKHQSAIKLMCEIKKMMDPNSILNPYKVLPQ